MYANDITVRTSHVNDQHAFLNGTSIFLYAKGRKHQPAAVHLDLPEGWRVATGLEPVRQFAPVFAVLVLALPIPGMIRTEIAFPLQGMATTVTHGILELIGVSTIKQGYVLLINGEQIAVGEACNGMRMVFAFGLVTYAFAFSTPLKRSTRIALLALSPLIALVCNVIRLVPTSLIYGYGTAIRAEWFHDVSGWVMLPIALLMLITVLRLLTWLEFPVTSLRFAIR